MYFSYTFLVIPEVEPHNTHKPHNTWQVTQVLVGEATMSIFWICNFSDGKRSWLFGMNSSLPKWYYFQLVQMADIPQKSKSRKYGLSYWFSSVYDRFYCWIENHFSVTMIAIAVWFCHSQLLHCPSTSPPLFVIKFNIRWTTQTDSNVIHSLNIKCLLIKSCQVCMFRGKWLSYFHFMFFLFYFSGLRYD